jgi:5-methylcytosine-specific restriction endonuclease McrA
MRARRKADKNARRRARAFGATEVEEIDSSFVRQRDNSLCHLCGKWVDVGEMSLDHVVPLAKGGQHTLNNVKLAHKVCNSRKGDKLMGEIDWTTF